MDKLYNELLDAIAEAVDFNEDDADVAIYEAWDKLSEAYEEAEDAEAVLRDLVHDAEVLYENAEWANRYLKSSIDLMPLAKAVKEVSDAYDEAFEAFSEAEDLYDEAKAALRDYEA